MKVRILFFIAALGIVAAFLSIYFYNQKITLSPPLSVNYNPYESGIYATGIVESYQQSGSNVNIFSDVSGLVTSVLVKDGQAVRKGDVILTIDDSVQKEIVEKDNSQAQAAASLLEELKAQPRKENLDIAQSQLDFAQANLVNVQDQLDKIKKSYALNPKSVSQNVLDNAVNAVKMAQENLNVAQNQYALTKAGAWVYDIQNQENQYRAAMQAYLADKALLEKYTIRSPIDGVVLRISAVVGGYVSPQGTYDTFTATMLPLVEVGTVDPYMEVRCYVNEILTPRLPTPDHLEAQMFIRGNGSNAENHNVQGIDLEFERIQPYTIPNIELSAGRAERVDVRVLPVIFKFKKPTDLNLYPGQLVDVYIKEKK